MKKPKRKQKNNTQNTLKKSILKISVFLVITGLNWTGLLAVGNTLAYFGDTENFSENIYSVGTLDFSLTNPNFSEFIGLTEELSFGSVLTNSGSLDFQYTVESEKISGDDFCNALELEVKLNGVKKHDDGLVSFSLPALTTPGSWSFEVELPVTATNIPHGKTCEVDFVFKGWQTDMATYENGGFSDEERFHLNLTSRMIVLNEFLPRPDGEAYGFDFGDDSSTKPRGEWVELYNNSDISYDLDGWYIWDASGDDLNKVSITNLNTLPGTTVISGRSWLVVYMNKAVLGNTGDTVELFDNTNTLIDSYTYTDSDYCYIEPTPEDENATTTTGSCGGVPPNKSYARIPDGIGSWVDPIPTPGLPNMLDSSANNDYSWLNELPVESSEGQIQAQPEEEPEEELNEEEVVEEIIEETIEEIPESGSELEEGTTTEATSTEETTEEATTTEEEILPEETPEEGTTTEEVIDEIIEDDSVENAVTTEEVIVDNELPPVEEENPTEEEPIQETEEIIEEVVEEPTPEETPIEEVPVIEEEPIIIPEEEPAVIPDDTPPQDENPEESSGDSGDSGEDISE